MAQRTPHGSDSPTSGAHGTQHASEVDLTLRMQLANLFAVRMTDAFRGSYPNADFAAIATAYERAYLAYMERAPGNTGGVNSERRDA